MVASLRDLPHPYHTLEEYYALERVGEARYEYWDGEIVCTSGGTRQHATISSNVHLLIGQQLSGKGCRAYTSEIQIKTPILPPYRYPDAAVVCGKPIFEKLAGFDVLTNPILIVEGLSSGSAKVDRTEKREAYQSLPSVMEYLLIEQSAPHITQYVRQPDGKWLRNDFGDLKTVVNLSSIECTLALDAVYDDVEFD